MSQLTQYLPLALLVIGVLAILVLLYLVLLLLRTGASAESDEAYDEPPPPPPPPEENEPSEAATPMVAEARRSGVLRGAERSFRRARKQLSANIPGPDPRYQVPWYPLFGATDSHRPNLLRRSGLSLPFGPPDDDSLPLEGTSWWFFDGGVVLDFLGEWVLDRSGVSSDDKGWQHLLQQLQVHRPKKPLDGVLLTLRAGDLLDAMRRGAEGINALEQRAALLYRKLWQLQKQLEIRFPVYVLIVDSQDIPGFHSLCRELPESLGDEIFGWSSPYTVDTAFRDTWVDEAFQSIVGRLGHVQTEIFATRPELADGDGVFIFPSALGELREPLRVFLSQVFKPSAYHESILFRGLYFSGTDELPGDRRGTDQRPRTYFLRQLLEQKVFPEAALARPTSEAVVGKNRRVRLAQIAAMLLVLLLGFGIFFTWQSRDRSRDILDAQLEEIQADLGRIQDGRRFERLQARHHVVDLTQSMAAIDTNSFRSIFLPASWFSRFDLELEDAFTAAFDKIVFTAIREEILGRTRELENYDPYRVSTFNSGQGSGTDPTDRRRELEQVGGMFGGGNPFLEDDFGDEPRSSAYSLARVCPEVLPYTELPQFRALSSYVHEVAGLEGSLERTLSLLEGLPTSNRQLRDLGEIIAYLFETSIEEGFYSNAHLYETALRRAISTQPDYHELLSRDEFPDKARNESRRLLAELRTQLFVRNALVRSLDELASSLDRLAGGDYGATTRQPFRQVVDALLCTEDVLSHPQLDWIFRSEPNIGPELDGLLSIIADSRILNPRGPTDRTVQDFPTQLEESITTDWRRLRRGLVEARSAVVGRHLESERDPTSGQRLPLRRLSGEARILELVLQDFIGQNFMKVDEVRRLRPVRPGDRLIWDTLLLEQAVELEAPYEHFRNKQLPFFPEELRTAIEREARNRMSQRILSLVARAQRTEPLPQRSSPLLVEPEIQGEIAGFQVASEYLLRTLGLFDRLNLRQDYNDLAEVLAAQGVRLLRQVETMREDEQLYRPRDGDFGWWSGQRAPNLVAFQVENPDELDIYLERQRNRIQHLAVDYAAPLITTLAKVGIENDVEHRALYYRWEAILGELNSYENKSPGNSVTGLEELIRTQMAETRLDDCNASRPNGSPAGTPRDFFSDRRNQMAQQLFERCQLLAFEHATREYAVAANFFNSRLAERFPFSSELPGKFDNEVEADDLREMFAGFDAYAKYFREVPPRLRNDATDRVAAFLRQMEEVRTFFAPSLTAEGDPPPPPIFDVDVEFRTNRCSEQGGDQILSWLLEVGETRIDHRSEVHVGRWQHGAPVSLHLRWAKDALRLPASVAPRRGVWIRGDEVIYEFDHDWALLGLLVAQQSKDGDFKAACPGLPNTLTLEVPTRPADRPADLASGELDASELRTTRVFVRVTPLAPETNVPLDLPEFPRRAPSLAVDPATRGR